ncbi:hypothetical protein P2W68_06465 [Chryseobacterium arthrosphaerae]|uniref:hypothetical protein n=1 Tax=Chryseobacterium arthrosphaerae TaxID=651561 RepID=UPI0023E2A5AF|nr:hypothetical protein [Chryseobacterium arthrosphaerae]WES99254.1 hypothetical protein P2W68_06465 [Chryseobacterium arthrosphaerae]
MDNNQAARTSWNNLTGTYTTSDGIEYAVSFNLQGSLTTGDQTVQAAAGADPIGNSVQELSDTGYNNWVTAKAGETRASAHQDNGGGGMTVNKKNIANKASVANTETRAHEKGHTLGLGENEGGVMDYAESFSGMSLPNGTNLQSVLTGAINKATTPSTLNTQGSKSTNTADTPNVIINVSGTYTGSGNFTDRKIETTTAIGR